MPLSIDRGMFCSRCQANLLTSFGAVMHASWYSCRGKTVMLDCGIHPGFSGMASLPYFDQVALEEVDAMLVTHFHLDHCAAVPFVSAKTPFRVRTRP